MDSLLATYASSDEEEEHHQKSHQPSSSSSSPSNFTQIPKPSSSISFSLPQPKSSSTFSSLPPPKSSSLFSSLPPPKPNHTTPISQSPHPIPKRVVQFKPPINPSLLKSQQEEDDNDSEEEEEEERKKPSKESFSSTETPSLKSFFSSLPPPKNSLGLGSGSAPSLGSGRKSVIEAEVPVSSCNAVESNYNGVESSYNGVQSEFGGELGSDGTGIWGDGSAVNVEDLGNGNEGLSWEQSYGGYGQSENYGEYGGSYVNYDASAVGVSREAAETSAVFENLVKMQGKRRRNEIPAEIVEVKQDELMKNRPREDQAKLTGIAFGPSYQPVSTTKGKPTKLHKRKHQIGSLYYDMRQKEMELTERRAKGFLTKAETQAKYGW